MGVKLTETENNHVLFQQNPYLNHDRIYKIENILIKNKR